MTTSAKQSQGSARINRTHFLLKQYIELIPTGKILDYSPQDGKNTFFLANRKYHVVALDSSQERIEHLIKQAEEKNLSIDFRNVDILDFKPARNQFSLIHTGNLLEHILKSQAMELIENILNGLKKNGLLIGTALTVNDPSCKEMRKKKVPMVEDSCFQLPNGWIYTFYNPREILNLIPALQVIHYSENDYYHSGEGGERWYGLVEFVFKKI